jgi:hypothetical protein
MVGLTEELVIPGPRSWQAWGRAAAKGWGTVQDDVAIWYRGMNYQLGRGRHGYGIWPVTGQAEYPLEQWPETPQGWAAAWSRFTAIEHPAAIVHLSSTVVSRPVVLASPGRSIGAAGLLAAGVACGVAGLFPAYLSGASLASDPTNLVPHVIYLATWLASGLLVASGGARRQVGALLGLGTSVVAFGYFFADLGTVISGTSSLGPGLALGLIGWLLCTTGVAVAAWPPGLAGAPRWQLARRGRPAAALAVTALLAAGVAIAFAPSWDSYTLRTPSRLIGTVTAGYIFSNPGPVIAGNIVVMVALVAVAAAAALWRPARLGAALLAGALIPMAAQAISAMIQVGQSVSPTQFGISPSRAAQVGLTITTGLTPAFWIYLALLVTLAGICAWLLIPARPRRQDGTSPAWSAPYAYMGAPAQPTALPSAQLQQPQPVDPQVSDPQH